MFIQLRILAKDGGTPALTAQVNVDITVRRNLFPPVFTTQTTILIDLPEASAIGTRVTAVQAQDNDQYVSYFYATIPPIGKPPVSCHTCIN